MEIPKKLIKRSKASDDKVPTMGDVERIDSFNNSIGFTEYDMKVKEELYKRHGEETLEIMKSKDKNISELFNHHMSVEEAITYFSK